MKPPKGQLRLFIFLFLLSLILPSCASSDKDADAKSTTEGVSGVAVTSETQDERMLVSDDLEAQDFGGEQFRILYRNGCARTNWALYDVHKIEIWTEEENGEVINDALYKRNKNIEDRFNVKIVGIPYPQNSVAEDQVASYAKKSIMSGADEFDLVVSWSTQLATLASQGLFLDWNTLPSINMSKPWWIQDAMDAYTVNGKTLLAMNHIIFSGIIGEAAFLMFNKNLLTDFGLDDPYKLVLDGKWTLDVLDTMVRGCYRDLNGDGVRNMDDTYGFTSDAWGSAYALMWTGGAHVTAKGDDELPYYDLLTERNVSLLEKVYKLFYENEGSAIRSDKDTMDFNSGGSKQDQAYLFSTGKSLFLSERVGVLCTPEYRNASFEFGILPMPKYDEAQEKYLTMINEHASVMAIPSTNTRTELTGKIIEGLAAESYRHLVPAYYEVALKTKYSRDETSVQMLDLIFDGVVYDFGLLYNIPTFDVYQTFLSAKKDPGTFVSYVEKMENSAKKKLQSVIDLYNGLE
ncbi:MAG: hypothetical protein AB9835_05145 [Eubacteriales bacterium]